MTQPIQSGQPQTIDVTGLPEEAIRTVQSLVALLRENQGEIKMPPTYQSRNAWAEAVRAWANNHPKRDIWADDSREAVYARQGE